MKISLPKLYYIHDPMCSWCWAFQPVWRQLQIQLTGTVNIQYLLGGLAADTMAAMPPAMQQAIQQHWRVIQQQVPETMFNFDFWAQCKPRRSTYAACRAVIAARQQAPQYEDAMIHAIQQAYYLEARNPSDEDTLRALAVQLKLDAAQFYADWTVAATQQQLLQEIRQAQQMGGYGFPSLILYQAGISHVIAIDYQHASTMLDQIERWLDRQGT